MATIQQILNQKGSTVLSVGPDDSVFDAIKTMATSNIGSLVVLEGEKVVGIFTERHYARNVFLKGRSSPKTTVKEIMSKHVIYATPDQSVEECMAVMSDKHVRHLPVLDGNDLVGIISIGDLVESIIGDQKFVIDQLVHYISS
ncbi:MAG: histidine kinase [Marinosulfonomonas sp.]|nr:MAG: histidine kinase [Marinosulfonomonas sp.]